MFHQREKVAQIIRGQGLMDAFSECMACQVAINLLPLLLFYFTVSPILDHSLGNEYR